MAPLRNKRAEKGCFSNTGEGRSSIEESGRNEVEPYIIVKVKEGVRVQSTNGAEDKGSSSAPNKRCLFGLILIIPDEK